MLAQDAYNQFAAVREAGPNGTVLHIFGDVDVITAPQFEAAIIDAAGEHTGHRDMVTLNLTRCRYLDSSGLAVLVRARRRLGSRLNLLVKPKSMISRLMQITAFDQIFNIATELAPRRDRIA